MIDAVLAPMPGSSVSVPGGVPRGSSSPGGSCATTSAASHEGLHPVRLGAAPGRAGRRPARAPRRDPSAARPYRGRSEVRRSLDRVMERFGFVGLAQRRQVVALQRARRRRRRSPRRTPFATTDPNVGVAKVPDHRLDALADDVGQPQRRARHRAVRRHRRAGRGGEQGRGPRQPVPGPHPRGRRHRLRAAGLRRRRRARRRPTRSSTSRVVEIELAWPTSRPSRSSSRSKRKAAQGRQVARRPRSRRSRPRYAVARRRARRSTGRRPRRRAAASCCGRCSCSPTSRCWPSSTSTRTSSADADAVAAPVRAELGGARRGARRVRAARGRGRASSTPTSGPRCSRASGSARARCPASCRPPTTCSGCARSSRPARRRAGRGRSGPGAKAPECAGVIHTDFERGLHPGRGRSTGTSCSTSGRGPRPATSGKLRVEGKDYEVQDGDVLEIRFNV